nr:MAG TPA: hypothetical protein [Caudoviricetes sp.]
MAYDRRFCQSFNRSAIGCSAARRGLRNRPRDESRRRNGVCIFEKEDCILTFVKK